MHLAILQNLYHNIWKPTSQSQKQSNAILKMTILKPGYIYGYKQWSIYFDLKRALENIIKN